jgi:hypothetical protein
VILRVALAPGASGSAPVWPFRTLQIGLVDGGGTAAAPPASMSAPFGLRYKYLSGGVNTGDDWESWGTGKGAFVTDYIAESFAAGITPVFSYYELRESEPGARITDESVADATNLADVATMRAYYENLERLFGVIAGETTRPVVVQIEPDLWGYVEQSVGDDARRRPVAVASTGLPRLAGLPNTMAGFARAIVRLRNLTAPHVLLGYHLSVWGTNENVHGSGLDNAGIDSIARRAVRFYRSLGARFDAVFAEYTNADAAYIELVEHIPDAFWNPADNAHDVRFLADVHARLRLPIVLWQIPVGNTLYRAENNTSGHYQDNHVQWLLDGSDRWARLRAYIRAGVVALLFGAGLPGSTCACDADHDGVTNPAPIDGNVRRSLNADDDGGFLRSRVRAYYAAGALRL